MAPFLVILGLLLLGVAIVGWHTRATWVHLVAHLLARRRKSAPAWPAEPDAFAHAPVSRSSILTPSAFSAPAETFPAAPVPASEPAPAPIAANESDPFAHAPALSDLAGFQTGETRH
jgi:hypothetical protein